ncbi:MAG TPA: penicillin acylase family protein, partial [Saprospiraceae bacterium]|nr:penicillin acylase family protein [Saprospiraceae bacterium]
YKYFDIKATPAKETARDVVNISFKKMCTEFAKYAANPLNKGGLWANYKNTTIEHLGKIPAFGRKDIKVDGFKDAINATTEYNGPSWRMVVQLSKPVRAYGIYPGGQSGNPASKYYDNMIDKWVNGQLDELVFMRNGEETDKILYTIELTNK